MSRAIIKLLEVVIVLLNSTDWINTEPMLYRHIADRVNSIIEMLRPRKD